MIAKCSSIGKHSFTLGDIETGEGSHCIHCGMSSAEALREDSITYYSRDQALDQLRDKNKAQAKQIDILTAKIEKVTQQRDDTAAQLSVYERSRAFYKVELEHQMAKRQPEPFIRPPTMALPLVAWLVGFSLTAGGVCAYAVAKLMGVV